MKTIVASLMLLAFTSWTLAGIKDDIPKSHRVILKGDWNPTPEETTDALSRIEVFLNTTSDVSKWSKERIKEIQTRFKKYRVQFKGITKGGKRLIWCNFFLDSKDILPFWENTPIEVLDGGSWYWQIDYDPAGKKCSNFSSNGIG